MGYSTVRRIMREGLTDPRNLDGIALWNSTRDVTDLTTDTGIKLWADKSGNSSTNVLCLNGVAGNWASIPDVAAFAGATQLDIKVRVVSTVAMPATVQEFCGQFLSAGNQRGFYFGPGFGGAGVLRLQVSGNGTGSEGASASTSLPLAYRDGSFTAFWARATWRASDQRVQFFTAADQSTVPTVWTQNGTDVTCSGAVAALFDSTANFGVGGIQNQNATENAVGNYYYCSVATTIDGANAVEIDFTQASKLAPSFVCTTGQTVTINTSGATGARISGARDLYQGTAANQPILTIAAAGNYLTFDGSNDYLKAAAFALSQPETVYFVGSQVTHAGNDTLYDGNAADTMRLLQAVSPYCTVFAGTTGVSGSGLGYALATQQIYSAIYNGASSVNRVNRNTAGTGQAGAGNANGFLLGAYNNGASGWANITAQEVLVYSGAHDKATQERVIAMLARNNRIALT